MSESKPAATVAAPDLFTTEDVAKRYGVSIQRVRQLARKRGVGRQLGAFWVFTESEVALLRPKAPGRPKVEAGS